MGTKATSCVKIVSLEEFRNTKRIRQQRQNEAKHIVTRGARTEMALLFLDRVVDDLEKVYDTLRGDTIK